LSLSDILNFSVQRTKRSGMAPLTLFNWGRPFVKLGEKGRFHLL